MTLDGVRFVFHNVPGSEAPAELTFYLPEKKALCARRSADAHHAQPLHAARRQGARRAALVDYIDEALQRFGDAEVLFASHHWPVWGNARIVDFMRQAARRVPLHPRPDHAHGQRRHEADADRRAIKLPKSLASEFSTPATITARCATTRKRGLPVLLRLVRRQSGQPRSAAAARRRRSATSSCMGGVDKAVAAAQAAFDKRRIRWTAELLNQVVFAQPDSKAGESAARAHLRSARLRRRVRRPGATSI